MDLVGTFCNLPPKFLDSHVSGNRLCVAAERRVCGALACLDMSLC
jgi:hypothetical protein